MAGKNTKIPCVIDGVQYKSVRCAAESLGISRYRANIMNEATKSFTSDPLYVTWIGMRQRVKGTQEKHRKRYSDRGINHQESWSDAETFINDVRSIIGDKPTPEHSLDRIDNNKGYFGDNIRWATDEEQAVNREQAKPIVTPHGKFSSLSQAARVDSINISSIAARVKSPKYPDYYYA